MRKLLPTLVIIFVVLSCATGCKTTTKVVTMHDTLTIERAVVQEVIKHDTLTITDNTERIEERIIYDTLERVKEVVKVQYRNKYIKEQGATDVKVVHDTITIQQGSTTKETEKKQSKSAAVSLLFIALLISAIFGYIYIKSKDW